MIEPPLLSARLPHENRASNRDRYMGMVFIFSAKVAEYAHIHQPVVKNYIQKVGSSSKKLNDKLKRCHHVEMAQKRILGKSKNIPDKKLPSHIENLISNLG
jgi:hypothetical protein